MNESQILQKACWLMDRKFEIAKPALKECRRLNEAELKELDNISKQLSNLRATQEGK
ncbi:hypothetical protein [Candidatus Enterococcus huntleyi]|uniref:hypothetical protein n=1 Tax=Candidatus Enterococcus huntleyi TaxID=1857217 RepID=UPI00137974C7|nr:hypothetical protein [Enterococcus sp. JM4C]